MNEDKKGWWNLSSGTHWKCSECGELSLISLWKECEPYCEDCGSHDGRQCPICDETFDHIWGIHSIEVYEFDSITTGEMVVNPDL